MKPGIDNPAHLTESTALFFQINQEEGGQGIHVWVGRPCSGQVYEREVE